MKQDYALDCIILLTLTPGVHFTLVSTHVISWIAIMSPFLSALDYIVKEAVSR